MKTLLYLTLALLPTTPAWAQTPPPPLVATALAVGELAPDFQGRDAAGQPVALRQLRQRGPVVLYFYRGQWCPYCNKALSQLQDSLQLLTAQGAQVVVVTPETPANIAQTVAKTKAAFPIIHDADLRIMRAYRTAFTVDEATTRKYLGYGIDLRQANGLDASVLPVPATYVIGTDGRIRFAFFDADYRRRASVRQVARALAAPAAAH